MIKKKPSVTFDYFFLCIAAHLVSLSFARDEAREHLPLPASIFLTILYSLLLLGVIWMSSWHGLHLLGLSLFICLGEDIDGTVIQNHVSTDNDPERGEITNYHITVEYVQSTRTDSNLRTRKSNFLLPLRADAHEEAKSGTLALKVLRSHPMFAIPRVEAPRYILRTALLFFIYAGAAVVLCILAVKETVNFSRLSMLGATVLFVFVSILIAAFSIRKFYQHVFFQGVDMMKSSEDGDGRQVDASDCVSCAKAIAVQETNGDESSVSTCRTESDSIVIQA